MSSVTAETEYGTIPRMFLAKSEEYGDRVAIVDGARGVTFRELAVEMRSVGASLIERGVQAGDRVAVWAPNSAAWVSAALGVLAAGAWLVPVNTRFSPREVRYLLEKTQAKSLIVAAGFMDIDPSQLEASGTAGWSDGPVYLPLPGEATTGSWDAFLGDASSSAREELDKRIASGRGSDISDVIFTSGTTGHPKGVMLRHGTSLRAYEALNEGFDVGVGDVHLVVPPFFHCFGYKAGWMLDLMSGATCIPMAVFNGDVVRLIQDHGITHISGPPTLFSAILDHPDRSLFELSSLRVAFVSATTIPEKLVSRLSDELSVELVMTGYGLTENHAIGAFTRRGTPVGLVSQTAGQMWPDVEARIVDDSNQPVPPGEAGEILLRGYSLMSGYYEDQEATDSVIKDGWLHTGDVGSLDAAGYLRILDRKKDMYIVGGFNVAPAEVEEALGGLPAVAQVSVIGVPDDRLGEVGAAFVVLREGIPCTVDEIATFSRSCMANYKVPRYVRFVDRLPMNATGKVLKAELRAEFLRAGDGR